MIPNLDIKGGYGLTLISVKRYKIDTWLYYRPLIEK